MQGQWGVLAYSGQGRATGPSQRPAGFGWGAEYAVARQHREGLGDFAVRPQLVHTRAATRRAKSLVVAVVNAGVLVAAIARSRVICADGGRGSEAPALSGSRFHSCTPFSRKVTAHRYQVSVM
jgi:hypothetical protein